MATIAIPRPIAPHRPVSDLAFSPPLSLDTFTNTVDSRPAPLSNKHIPICPPGPVPRAEPSTPPPSPRKDEDNAQLSLLYPPDSYQQLVCGTGVVYRLAPSQVAAAVQFASHQPLPEPADVFPWLHGLHPDNQIQNGFLIARRRGLRKTPTCLRGVALVKANGDLTVSKLKAAISPQELLRSGTREFPDVDPKQGFSVRNFHIQTAKCAYTSDIVVYGDDEAMVQHVAGDLATAQQAWYEKHEADGIMLPRYNTFICANPFADFELKHPELVAINSTGFTTGSVVDFFQQERSEMCDLTQASEISHNVWLGSTPDLDSPKEKDYDVFIKCSDFGTLDPRPLQDEFEKETRQNLNSSLYVEFPSSGSILPPLDSHGEADAILETCKWIYRLAHGSRSELALDIRDKDGDSQMSSSDADRPVSHVARKPRRILIHCADGYSESTMLGIAYFSYSTGRPVPQAWLELHTVMQRAFFAYPPDVALLTTLAPRLLIESPVCKEKSLGEITELIKDEPKWMRNLDGSFPSQVMEYMYLGNLGHANNPALLEALGIGQILSVGETTMWRNGDLESWGEDNICLVQGVQDNGIDPLADELERCLEFIDRGRKRGTATLVHCRVGVSRSATICIAEVMRELEISLPRAYCFVRARRLNVIIQPHLRFAYELLKWEEKLTQQRSTSRAAKDGVVGGSTPTVLRELEWATIAREIAAMNRPYLR